MPNPNNNLNKKRAVKKRSSLGNSSSDQKENQPKKRKINKPDMDGIAMTKQLLLKKMQSQSNNRTKRQKQSKNRVCPNGKVMPSLAELELLFEDSDDDDHPKTTTATHNNTSERPTTPDTLINNPDIILTPTTRTRIKEHAKLILANNSIPKPFFSNTIEPPPAKKPRPLDNNENELPYIPQNSLTDNIITNTTCKSDKEVNINDERKINTSSTDAEPNKKIQEPILDDGNSSDSNDTIEYKLSPARLQTTSVLQTFCPLPSTSKDNQTFIKNDELFSQSLKEITVANNDPAKQDSEDIEIIETPIETVTIADGIKKEKNYDSPETVKPTPLNNPSIVMSNSHTQTIEDDDCMIVETAVSKQKKKTQIYDVDYPSVVPDMSVNNTNKIYDDIIDVDALIAHNQTVLNKLSQNQSKASENTNIVVDVDVSTINKNSSARRSEASKESTNNLNTKIQANSDCEVVDITDIASSSKDIQVVGSQMKKTPQKVDNNIDNFPVSGTLRTYRSLANSRSQAQEMIQEVNSFFRDFHNPVNDSDCTALNLDAVPWLSFLSAAVKRTKRKSNQNNRSRNRTNRNTRPIENLIQEPININNNLNGALHQSPKRNEATSVHEGITVNNNTVPPSSPQKTSGNIDQLAKDTVIFKISDPGDEKQQAKSSDLYNELVQLEQKALVTNAENFECEVCMEDYSPGHGVVLRECVHIFCKDCLVDVIRNCEEPNVSCPATGCPGQLLEREIRALVTPQDYERWLARGLAVAESGTRNSFHCRTRDCKGWALCEQGVEIFPCPVCRQNNCVPCQAIHTGETCKQYRFKLKWAGKNVGNSDDKTRLLLRKWISKGRALECPECGTIITKNVGCDWIVCSACKTEICWATRGRRWGRDGPGDISGGCRCGVNGKRCHPMCGNCH